MQIVFLFLSFFTLASPSSAAAMPLTEESSDPATRSEGGFQVPMKRNAAQFGAMILCETKRNPLDYNGYGCYCGLGGKGTPVDEIDRCCYDHDQCYNKITKKKICPFNDAVYITVYIVKGCSRCAERSIIGNSRYQKKLCECDAAAARCFKKYNSKFKNRYKNYKKSSCKTQ